MKDFFEYIKNPIPLENIERFTLKVFIKFVGLSYILSSLLSVFLVIFKENSLLPEYSNAEINSLTLFLAVTLFVPLIEEIVFRLNLKISKLNIAAFLSVLILVIFKLIFLRGVQIYIYLGAIPIFVPIYYIINRSDLPLQKIETFWKSNFKYIFHIFAITFGLLHLTNFETIKWWMIVISPLLAAPHITAGYIIGVHPDEIRIYLRLANSRYNKFHFCNYCDSQGNHRRFSTCSCFDCHQLFYSKDEKNYS